MTFEIDPLYNDYFPIDHETGLNWNFFKKYDLMTDISTATKADFKLTTKAPDTWKDTVLKVALVVLKIVLFPWGLYEGIKFIARELGMDMVYPAHTFSKDHVMIQRLIIAEKLKQNTNLIARSIILEKDGTRFSATIIGKAEKLSNRKWALFSLGNLACVEDGILSDVHIPALDAGYNLLMVNGPSVGLSEGAVTIKMLGEVQELGLQFLETAIKAKNIVIAGHSLGGAADSLLINEHKDKFDTEKRNYLFMRLMTFKDLSSIILKKGGIHLDWIRWWLECEIDLVEASKKLSTYKIEEILIKGEVDTLMEGVDLHDAVQDVMGKDPLKTFITVPGAGHTDLPGNLITQLIKEWDAKHPISQNKLVDVA